MPGQGKSQIGGESVNRCPSSLLGQTMMLPIEGTVRFTDLALTKATVGQYLSDVYPHAPLKDVQR